MINEKFMELILLISIAAIITSIGASANVITSTNEPATNCNCKCNQTDSDDRFSESFQIPEAKPFEAIKRSEWLAQPPRDEIDPLHLPVDKVIIVHSATAGCETQSACIYRVRFIQDYHIGVLNFVDISYNFLIGGDGNVYEGRGWLNMGSFLRGQNSKSIGIAFIGDYRRIAPTQAQMKVLNDLLANGTASGYLKPNFKLFGARQFIPTESPGKLLYEELQKHPHWSDELE